jgi:DNA-binding NarL/FixJ family response regulator
MRKARETTGEEKPAAETRIRAVAGSAGVQCLQQPEPFVDAARAADFLSLRPSGTTSARRHRELHPDVIVMDLSMPVMNGIEAAGALKRLMPTVPLIIFSENSNVFSDAETRSAGVAALVSKSEHISVLISKARAVLYDIAA